MSQRTIVVKSYLMSCLKDLSLLCMGLIFLAFFPYKTIAGTWTSVGPEGGGINSVAVSPNFSVDQTLFSGTSGGVYKSTNGGINWIAVNNLYVNDIALSPNFATDQTLFSGTSSGVYKSTNGGANWTAVNTGLNNLNVYTVVISPNYVSDQTLFAGTYYGVYKSTNGGGNWTAVNTGLGTKWVTTLAISPSYTLDQTLFAGTSGSGVYKSTNGGTNWTAVNTGIDNLYVYALVISPNYITDQTLFAGTYGVYKSTNGGSNWTAVDAGLNNLYVNALVISPIHDTDQTLFAGTSGGGVFKSTNGGSNWIAVNAGLNNLSVGVIALSPMYDTDQTLFAGTSGGGVFKSTNGGSNWTAFNTGLNNLTVNALALSPGYITDQTLFAGTYYGGVFKTVDGGSSWISINTGLNYLSVDALALSPNYVTDQTLFAGNFGGVFKSTNGGSNWTAVNTGLSKLDVNALALSPSYITDQTLFAGTYGGGVFKSTNGGLNWTAVNTGLNNLSVNALALSPDYLMDQTLFAGANGGIFKSTNGGASWISVNTGLSALGVNALVLPPGYITDQTLFAGTYGGGVFKSTNGGSNWTAVNTGVNNLFVHALAISSNYVTDQTLFVGTRGGGVFKSDNGGMSWTGINTGLSSLTTFALSISPRYACDGILFNGTSFASVWRYTDIETLVGCIYSIHGSVTENGTGLNGVTMTLSGDVSETTTTASDGTYSFTNLANGSYSVAPDLFGYTFTPNNRSVTISGADMTAQDFSAACVQYTYYRDADGDTYGNPLVATQACTQPAGYVADNTDCNDNDTTINPSVLEVCNGSDDDCNSQIDDGIQRTYYEDADGDAYGNASATTLGGCTAPAGYVSDNTDCDDMDASVNPGITEVCNSVDDNCDSQTDEGVQGTYYRDADNDTYGDASMIAHLCAVPAGYVSSGTDCDDRDAFVNPGAAEVCNGLDDNCNGQKDEGFQDFCYPAELPRTGQTTCYNSNGSAISCQGTGQDGEIQATIAWPSPRFTVSTDGYCVTDNLSGLMWVRSPDSSGRTWQQALDYANSLNLCGFTDWRLPNASELESLVNAGQTNTSTYLNTQGFNNVQSSYYWSSTTFAVEGFSAWIISMGGGSLDRTNKSLSYYTWPVRAGQTGTAPTWETGQTVCYNSSNSVGVPCDETGQDGDVRAGVAWPISRFTVSTDGQCVTDKLTGLMWVRSPGNWMTWQQTLDYANNLNLCGYTDWRLPNRKELLSLVNFEQFTPALPSGHPFLNVGLSAIYWSSTSDGGNTDNAWLVDIKYGYTLSHNKVNSRAVWPVRSGHEGLILGTVTENGVGLSGVTITLGGDFSATTTTASDGSYSFTGITSGNYTITPSHSGYTFNPSSRSIIGAGSGVTAQDFSATCMQDTYYCGGAVELPKTGQVTCYDSTGNIVSCAETGQDGDTQAGVSWPSTRFTDNNNETILDNLTGLMWTKNGYAPGPAACSPAASKTWQGALDYVTCLNANSYLGYTDWRLPNINEIESLINSGQADTASWLNTLGFTNVQGQYYWSSTSSISKTDYAWIVALDGGSVRAFHKSDYSFYVLPVRSDRYGVAQLWKTWQTTCYDTAGNAIVCSGTGQDGDVQAGIARINPRFADHGDGSVTDNLTELMWTKNANLPGAVMNWQQALDYVSGMNSGIYPNFGYTDWRLPNRKELYSLTDFSQHNPSLSLGHPFVNVDGMYWSSTSITGYAGSAWGIDIGGYSGVISLVPRFKSGAFYCTCNVWPVRSGQIDPSDNSIHGVVTNNGGGLSGAIIELSGSASTTTITAIDGTYSFTSIPDGVYTITPVLGGYSFTPLNQAVTVSVSSLVNIDFTATQIIFEETDPAITYTGSWTPYICSMCSGGALKYSKQTGARVEFSFNGTGIMWNVIKGSNMGKAKVYLDGANMLIDLYSPSYAKKKLSRTGLTPGNHTIVIEVSGQKNTNATDRIINIDAFEVVP